MKKILPFYFLLLILNAARAQDFQWVKHISGAGWEGAGHVERDASGNFYLTGVYTETLDFDPGPDVYELTAAGVDMQDIYLLKLDPAGNFLWVKSMGGVGRDVGNSIAIDHNRNIYLTGYFGYLGPSADFDPGPDEFLLTAAGVGDIFVAKYDEEGNFLWAKSLEGTGSDDAASIDVDALGNCYVGGHFSVDVDFDPGPDEYIITSQGGWDNFILKLDNDGNFVWAKSTGGTYNERTFSLMLGEGNNIYSTGFFELTADFDPGADAYEITTEGDRDIFILNLNSDGEFIWVKTIGDYGDEEARSIYLDNSENIYITGHFVGSVDFDPGFGSSVLIAAGGWEIFVGKYDNSGNFIWAKNLGGESTDEGIDVVADNIGNVYSTGYYHDGGDFDPGFGTYILNDTGSGAMFISKLGPTGNFISAYSIGGNSYVYGNSIIVDTLQNIYVTGDFYRTADFDPGPDIYNLLAVDVTHDIYLLKLGVCDIIIPTQPVDQIILPGDDVMFVTSASATSMQWQEGDGTGFIDLVDGGQYSGVNNDTLTITDVTIDQDNFQYRCIITDGLCSDTTKEAALIIDMVEILEIDEPAIHVFPNPSMGKFMIQTNDLSIDRISIFNSEGIKIFTNDEIKDLYSIDLQYQASGVYLLLFETLEGVYTRELFIVK
ncbi:MAG: SBBP repeat-containing protein [Chitinophagales bacterium]